ncbi:hypothetical protein BLNAU_16914 [Blattamonas nauphoetae]|uniref:Uncharacterized protein n=1 Tax=Blattamonas nauphoetae TaxID=2049346 RepID=A0ABQ9XB68_9EUKA|nr:hypothetical protein BLNAU_16914 [Blattamonas nauphoetae]
MDSTPRTVPFSVDAKIESQISLQIDRTPQLSQPTPTTPEQATNQRTLTSSTSCVSGDYTMIHLSLTHTFFSKPMGLFRPRKSLYNRMINHPSLQPFVHLYPGNVCIRTFDNSVHSLNYSSKYQYFLSKIHIPLLFMFLNP